VVQVIFPGTTDFMGGDVVGTIIEIVGKLGAEGLVGLASVAVIYAIFKRG